MKLSKLHLLMATFALSSVLCAAPQIAIADDEVYEDNTEGSFLVFPKFDIRADTSTQLRIVNNKGHEVDVMLNYVCPGVKHVNEFCAALNTELSFTAHQTRIIDVADQNPPCNQGYVVAFAINNYGHAKAWDHLYGSYHIYQGRRHETDNAISIESDQQDGAPLGSNGKLRFQLSGGDYHGLPTKLYTDFRSVNNGEPAEGSRITLLTLDVLAGMQNPPAVAFVDFWNSAEVPYSSSVEFICWAEYQLDDIDLNFLEENLGTAYGSMTVASFPNCPIPGACPPLVPYDAAMLGAITEYGDGTLSGHTLSHNEEATSAEFQPR